MTKGNATGRWPKYVPPLTEEQKNISDDFMRLWHEKLPRYSAIEEFNHGWVVKNAPGGFTRTLEIGAGLGEHLKYERLSAAQEAAYVTLELRENMAAEIKKRFPRVRTVVADCQRSLDFPDDCFDRIVAVHVLEHLPDLPAAIREMWRLCDKDRGVFQVVIPCEGGLAYTLCRRISAQRIFEKRYKQSYRWFIEREHLNLPQEIMEELARCFSVDHRTFFPLLVPAIFCNLCFAMNLRPRREPA
ncbi:MAG: class I SAM-dependent methyltransferase [Bryobacteraceae bacterium]